MSIKSLHTAAALLVATALLSACVSQKTHNTEVQKANTYQQLDNQLKAAP